MSNPTMPAAEVAAAWSDTWDYMLDNPKDDAGMVLAWFVGRLGGALFLHNPKADEVLTEAFENRKSREYGRVRA